MKREQCKSPWSPENLARLKKVFVAAKPEILPKPIVVNRAVATEIAELSTKHLKPFLDELNREVLDNRGVFKQVLYRGRNGDDLSSSWKLVWDQNGTAGRSLELGVESGRSKQIFVTPGRNCPTIFSHLKEVDGSVSQDWQKEVQAEITEIFEQHYDWTIFK